MHQAQSTNSQNQSRFISYRNQIKYSKGKINYRQPTRQTRDKDNNIFQIMNPDQDKRKAYYSYGKKWMRDQNSLAIVIFAGGFSTRMNNNEKSKQFIQVPTLEGIDTTLFNNTLQRIGKAIQENQNIVLYIICSRKNSQQVLNQVEDLVNFMKAKMPIYVCFQPQYNVLDPQGLQSVYTIQPGQVHLKLPAGIGAFKQAQLFYSIKQKFTLKEHITQITKPSLVYCVGTCNSEQKGINLQMIGLLTRNQYSLAFECSYTETQKEDLPLICIREKQRKQSWLVMQYANLLDVVQDRNKLYKFPVWMDNFVFNPKILQTKHLKNNFQLSHQFNLRVLTNNQNQKLQCLIPQATISYALMREKQKCVGYVTKFGKFLKTAQNLQTFFLENISMSPSKIVRNSSMSSPQKASKNNSMASKKL